ncbi:hypothetical protein [Paracoccus sp. KR1-242]|uniref:hypothetical protein n=1 Tax=Paracoccus sp. KR1-242 TaxID=3410028 RepID=UPI003C0DECCE
MKVIVESDVCIFFKNLGQPPEIKLNRRAARQVCERATELSIYVLGIDVGMVSEHGYEEDSNEGWVSNSNLLTDKQRIDFENGFVPRELLQRNNLAALRSFESIAPRFNAYIITARRIHDT